MPKNHISDVIAAPLGDVVAEIGLGVAKAQYAIDANAIEHLKDIYSQDDITTEELRNLGYRPTWYVIPEAKAEVNLALSITQSQGNDGKRTTELSGTTVDAGYQNQYDYNVEASSKLTLTYVPVPAPSQLDDLHAIPQLTNFTVSAARIVLERLGIPFALSPQNASNSATISKTEPEAGALMDKDQTLKLII